MSIRIGFLTKVLEAMKGMELSERFFRDWAEPVLRDACGELLERCAAGLVGPNSQAMGYDDEIYRVG